MTIHVDQRKAACFLLSIGPTRVLLDAGLHPARRHPADRYPAWEAIPSPTTIDVVLLSHAHLDHAGALPLLTEVVGHPGPVYASAATRDLLPPLFDDLLAGGGNGCGGGPPVLPPYTATQAAAAVAKVVATPPPGTPWSPAPGVVVVATVAGHALGALSFAITAHGRRVVYAGDLSEVLLLLDAAAGGGGVLGRVPILGGSPLGWRVNTIYRRHAGAYGSPVRRGPLAATAGSLSGSPAHPAPLVPVAATADAAAAAPAAPAVVPVVEQAASVAASAALPTAAAAIGHRCTANGGDATPPAPLRSPPTSLRCRVLHMPLSSHADERGLVRAVRAARPTAVAVVHGEPDRVDGFAARLRVRFAGLTVLTPSNGSVVVVPTPGATGKRGRSG
ncbi:hypothetical protein I4F81_010056 [Pyropia yezoensis]|uniref:Uncharacterized protein n=1 Tax=Pyropia yezoensis TaxID=2788 RepID=A0ACC3CBS6_PYRYE|nr:hypothetical protein I4F81_010056 [Neopyropia yezoensis]